MTSITSSDTTTTRSTYKRAIPAANLAKVSPLRSVGVKVFGYLLVPSLLASIGMGLSLFNREVEGNKNKLLAVAEQTALDLAVEQRLIIEEAATARQIYDQLVKESQSLDEVKGDKRVIAALKKLKANPLSQAGFEGSLAIIDRESESKLLYAHSDQANSGLYSFEETIPKLSKVATTIDGQQSRGVVSLEGSLWAYSKIGDTGLVVVAEMPEQATGVWRTLFLTTGIVLVIAGLVAVVFVFDYRSRLKVLIDACAQLERTGNIPPISSEQGDELDQVQLAVARALQAITLKEERFKEELADAIRQEERKRLRQDQEQEAQYLETEIGGLLDVVSALEEGDLTVQAEVSDRATGLVADTLNRLREQLAEVIAGVLAVAQEVADGASGLEQMAQIVSENVENQAQSVAKGRALTEQVAQLAQDSVAMVRESSQALATIQSTVEQGQVAINTLTEAIGVLQEGTVKIIQRMKTLGEFVGLAEQFVQDQGQIASLTQVLAINATLVAARAAEQRDPKQFIGVAREFEAIAGQVNNLATQTNEGLGVLQQRTGQIQAVVSAIDAEVQGLGRLVEGFTKGVEKSQKAFNEVQTVTIEVVATGQKVSESSNEIANAAESTARYISEIATLAEQTANLTAEARTQAEIMGELAQQLLQGIRYFRLPVGLLPESK
jgi:methyl-accepting chemotaxis protein PixJ